MRYLMTLLLSLVLLSQATAQELPHFYKGVRPLGMGGAFTAVADDENALFYYPAGLNRIEERSLGVFNPLIDSSAGSIVFYNDVQNTDLGAAGSLPQQLNIGISVSHKFSGVQLTDAADWINLLENLEQDNDLYKRLHLGLEARLAKYLSLRTGLSQGYGSLGVGMDFKLLKLEYANYAEELSSLAGGKVDRRHVIQFALGW